MKNHKFHASLLLAATLLGASSLMVSCNDDETSSTHKVPQAKVLRTAVASGVYTHPRSFDRYARYVRQIGTARKPKG